MTQFKNRLYILIRKKNKAIIEKNVVKQYEKYLIQEA